MIAGIIAFIVTYFILNALNLNNSLALIIAVVVGVFVAWTRKKSKEGKEGKGQDPRCAAECSGGGCRAEPDRRCRSGADRERCRCRCRSAVRRPPAWRPRCRR